MAHIKWGDLKVCGKPVMVDPDQDPNTLQVFDGQLLIIEMHFDGDTFIGATGHVETEPPPDPEDEA